LAAQTNKSMKVAISMLRGINVGGHNIIKMEALRAMHESLGLRGVQTYVQSGNVVFRTSAQDLGQLAGRIENQIEQTAGFRPSVIIRSATEFRALIGKNPFAARPGIEPGKLLIIFLAARPTPEAAEKMQGIRADPEELRIIGREVFAYLPNGIGRAKLPPLIERTLKTAGTGRNWNTVTKLLEMAEKLEAS
jgi:uncharacterized protein (DUF1697 family)